MVFNQLVFNFAQFPPKSLGLLGFLPLVELVKPVGFASLTLAGEIVFFG